jgi:hypothetical protein
LRAAISSWAAAFPLPLTVALSCLVGLFLLVTVARSQRVRALLGQK